VISAKTLISAGIVGVLAAQVYAMAPGTSGSWYWPFMNYPMYSAAKQPGAGFSFRRLEAVPCDAGGPRAELPAETLGVQTFRFRNLLETAAGGRRDAPAPSAEAIDEARAALAALARRHAPAGTCTLEITTRDFVVDAAGLVDPTPPERGVARWPLGAEAAR
jgi:hypothetical protein